MLRHCRFFVLVLLSTISIVSFAAETEPSAALEHKLERLKTAHLYKDAFREAEKAVEAEPDNGMYLRLLGELYASGVGITRDSQRAITLYRKASEQGDPGAQFLLGQAYESGVGVPASPSIAFSWYERAALAHPRAAQRYAEIVLANKERTSIVATHDPLERLQFAADHGIDNASLTIANLLLNDNGSSDSQQKAIEVLSPIADRQVEANTLLATIDHRAKNYTAAKIRFARSLEQGDAVAAAYLAYYAEHGVEEPKDRKKALRLYAKAKEIQWAAEGYERLVTHFNSVELLGLRTYGTHRSDIKRHYAVRQFPFIGGKEYFDVWNVSRAFPNKNVTLTAGYAPGTPEYVAELSYAFAPDKGVRVKDIFKEMSAALTSKYGEPVTNKRIKGVRTLVWERNETTIILVNDKKLVSIAYRLSPYYQKLSSYLKHRNQSRQGSLSNAL